MISCLQKTREKNISLIKFPISLPRKTKRIKHENCKNSNYLDIYFSLTNIWQNFFKLLLVATYYFSDTNIPHWLSHISCRRADLTPGRQPRPVLSHSRPNRTIDHSLNKPLSISLPQNSPSSPETHPTMNFTGNSAQFLHLVRRGSG